MNDARAAALARIKRNIEESGFHIYIVAGGPTPRFGYTIGLRESLGAELVLAGALLYDKDHVLQILHALRKQLAKEQKRNADAAWREKLGVRWRGSFTFRKAHGSWTRSLLLGALDYYGVKEVDAYQIVPDDKYRTIDVPDMTRAWSAIAEPVWQWLHEP